MDPELARLHRRYAETRGARDLEALVVRYRGLARSLARRYQRAGVAEEDLEQVACVGLVKAIQNFDLGRNCAFSTYAVPMILGELRHFCRQTLWPVHVPRAVQERVLAVRRVTNERLAACGRAPTVRELAERLRYDDEDVLDAVHAGASLVLRSVDAAAGDDGAGEGVPEACVATEDPGYAAVEDRVAVEAALGALTHEELELVRLRFGEELSHRQIATRVGMSASQVGRSLAAIIERLSALDAVATDSAAVVRRRSPAVAAA